MEKAKDGEEAVHGSDDEQQKANILKAMKGMDAGGGKNIIAASIETFSMADGKTKKGDILVPTMEEALDLLNGIVEKCVVAEAEKLKKGDPSHKRNKWEFATVPLREFEKTMDDVFVSFLKWARVPKDGKKEDLDEDEGGSNVEMVFNVTKAYRRLEAYADWMDDTGDDLLKLTPSSIKEVNDAWKMTLGYTKSGHLTWWMDFKDLDLKGIKAFPEIDSLRLIVWYSHFVMFDEKAQEQGCMMIENMAKMGFFAMMTLIPPKLSAKMDRLTIGVLPVKFKKIFISECSTWVNIIMAIMKPFMSKKLRSRIVTLDKGQHSKLVEACGGLEYVLKGYGPCEGTYTDNVIADKFA